MSPQASAEFAEVHKMPSTNAPSTFVIVLCHISSCHGITYIVTRTGRYEHRTGRYEHRTGRYELRS